MKLYKFMTISVFSFGVFYQTVSAQVTFLDSFLPTLRAVRERFNVFIQPKTFEHGVSLNVKNKRTQPQFPDTFPFFCDVNGAGARSKNPPTSVHKLRPGDIDIIGAIGDSFTTGASTFSNDLFQIWLDGKGAVWSIGGQYTWRQFLTIPNILKEFNPKLYGFSVTGQGNSYKNSSYFNVAEVWAKSSDTIFQAKNLVKRMRSDPKLDMENDWKLVTYMIGGIDFCYEICIHESQEEVIEIAARNLITALRILRKHLPRTMVNVVLPPNPLVMTQLTNKPGECHTANYFECPCYFTLNDRQKLKRSMNTVKRWHKRMSEIVKLPEFHSKNDFEVNLFSLFVHNKIPKDSNGQTDYKYLAKDCFHLSQLGQARAANSHWNAMLTPENQRDRRWKKEFEEIRCPTDERPFLATTRN